MEFNETRQRISDRVRNLIYPIIPMAIVAIVWATAWASSLESKANMQNGPVRIDASGCIMTGEGLRQLQIQRNLNPPMIASSDDSH